ncbi:unnamed protein product, partial [Meganyctiphanes norvegica]
DGSHRVERGGTENNQVNGTCYDSGFSITCYCSASSSSRGSCNSDLCQHCDMTSPPYPTMTSPPYMTTTDLPITQSPATATQLSTTNQPPTPDGGPLGCYSCIDCNVVDGNTHVEVSEEFLTCFTAIELGTSHFVIRGGSPDYFEDGSCRPQGNGVYECYCTTSLCNDDAELLLQYGAEHAGTSGREYVPLDGEITFN